MPNKNGDKVLSNNSKMMSCERIWVGKYKDDLGTFEILVPACDRYKAIDSIETCLDKIKKGKIGVIQKIVGEPYLLYLDEVGGCDYIRE
jgi:hypothetical protein